MTVSPDLSASVLPDVMLRAIDGKYFILNIKTERYFGLDTIGTRMFNLLCESASTGQALDQLQREFDVDPAVLSRDLATLIGQLVQHGLIQLRPVGTVHESICRPD